MLVKLFYCPACRKQLKLPAARRPAKVMCGLCRAIFRMPSRHRLAFIQCSPIERMTSFFYRSNN